MCIRSWVTRTSFLWARARARAGARARARTRAGIRGAVNNSSVDTYQSIIAIAGQLRPLTLTLTLIHVFTYPYLCAGPWAIAG